MRCFSALLLLILLSASARLAAGVETKIFGGKDAPANEWPWMVAVLQNKNDLSNYQAQFCAGSLITPRWIVSAAHCFRPKDGNVLQSEAIRVLLDTIELCNDCTDHRRPVAEILVHPGWDTGQDTNNANDIALLRLSNPIDPAAIPRVSIIDPQRSASLPQTGHDDVQALGWGTMFPESEEDASGVSRFPTTLQQVALDFVNLETCKDFYNDDSLFSKSMVCAHEPDAPTHEPDDRGDSSPDNPSAGEDTGGADTFGEDTCKGDSGGPLFRESDGADWLAGITSWGSSCGDASLPGVYTEVLDFVDWIERQTQDHGPVVDMTGTWSVSARYAAIGGTLDVTAEIRNNALNNNASSIEARVGYPDSVDLTDDDTGDTLDCTGDGSGNLHCTGPASLAAQQSVRTPVAVDHAGPASEQVKLTLTASAGEGDYRSGNDRVEQTLIFSDKPDLEAEFGTPHSSGKTASIPLTIRNVAPHQASGNLRFSLTLGPALRLENAAALNCDSSHLCHPGDALMASSEQQYSLKLSTDRLGTHALEVDVNSASGDFPATDTEASTTIRFSPKPPADSGSSGGAGLLLVLAAYARRKKRSIS